MASHHNAPEKPQMNIQTGASLFNDIDEEATGINELENYVLMDSFNEDEVKFFVPPKIVCAYPNVICCTQL